MPASLNEWVDNLADHTLPALSLTLSSLRELMGRANSTHADYQRIVARDPGFALFIFRYLGALPRPPREPITNLSHAIALCGMAPLEAGTNEVAQLSQPVNRADWNGLQLGYSRAVHAAHYALDLGTRRGDTNPEEMMLAALLSECGELALWSRAPAQMQAIERAQDAGSDRESAALEILGCTLPQLNTGLAEVWSLPLLVQQSQPYAGAFQPRSLGVMLGTALARSSARDWNSAETLGLVELSAEYVGEKLPERLAQTHRTAVEVAHSLADVPLPLSAPALLSLGRRERANPRPEPRAQRTAPPPPAVSEDPPADPSSATSSKIQASPAPTPAAQHSRPPQSSAPLDPGRRAQSAPPADPPTQRPAARSPVRKPTSLTAPTDRSESSPDDARLQAELKQLFRELREEAGLRRIVFAMVTPDRKTLRARFVVGADKESPLRRFRIDLERRSLFAALLAKPQSFWLNTGNRDKYLPAIPGAVQKMLDQQGFFAGALHIHGEPVGLVYADSSSGLDKIQFRAFQQACEQLQTRVTASGSTKRRALG